MGGSFVGDAGGGGAAAVVVVLVVVTVMGGDGSDCDCDDGMEDGSDCCDERGEYATADEMTLAADARALVKKVLMSFERVDAGIRGGERTE